jgi:hypothetical protein
MRALRALPGGRLGAPNDQPIPDRALTRDDQTQCAPATPARRLDRQQHEPAIGRPAAARQPTLGFGQRAKLREVQECAEAKGCVMAWLMPGLLTIAFYFVFRRSPLFRRLSPERGAILCSLVVIAASIRSLVTGPREGLWFGLHWAVLGAALAFVIVAAAQRFRRS